MPVRKQRLNVYFDAPLLRSLDEVAARRRVSKSAIVEAAVASALSPDAADQRDAAIIRRLDRLTRAFERLERDLTISTEALALFVRFWLTTTPPLPDTLHAAAQAKGRERYENFVETLGRRLAKGQSLSREVSFDAAGGAATTGSNTDPA
jgi:hypothetical protein